MAALRSLESTTALAEADFSLRKPSSNFSFKHASSFSLGSAPVQIPNTLLSLPVLKTLPLEAAHTTYSPSLYPVKNGLCFCLHGGLGPRPLTPTSGLQSVNSINSVVKIHPQAYL